MRILASVSLVLFLATAPVAAQANRLYRDGKDAIEAGSWAEAEAKMRSAIQLDPEARRKTFSRYSPYYYLGVALAEQGDCRGALEAWRQSQRYGALKEGGEELQDMQHRQQRCSKLVNDVKLVRAQAVQAIEKAEEAAESLARLSRHQTLSPMWGSGSPSFAAMQRQAGEILETARSLIEPGDRALDRRMLAEASSQAEDAGRRFESAIAAAEQRLGEVNEAVRGAMAELDKAERSASNLLRAIGKVAPYPQRLGSQVSALRLVMAKIDRDRNSASSAELEALTEDLIRETRALRPLAEKPPSALLDAGVAYLSNDFQGVLDRLATERFRGDRPRFHALLLQAAAIHGLYVMSGEQDSELLEGSEALIRQLADMDPSLGRPGERFFSPRFRRIYEEVTRTVLLERQETEAAAQLATEAAGEETQ